MLFDLEKKTDYENDLKNRYHLIAVGTQVHDESRFEVKFWHGQTFELIRLNQPYRMVT